MSAFLSSKDVETPVFALPCTLYVVFLPCSLFPVRFRYLGYVCLRCLIRMLLSLVEHAFRLQPSNTRTE